MHPERAGKCARKPQLRLYPVAEFRYQAGRGRHGAAVFGVETAGNSQLSWQSKIWPYVTTARRFTRRDQFQAAARKEDEMTDHVAISWTRRSRRPLVTSLAVAALSVAAVDVFAQQAPAPAQQQRPAQAQPQRPAAQPARPAQQRPAQAPAQQQQAPAAQAQQAPAQGDLPPLIYSPWAKFCNKAPDPNAKQVCFTGRDARTETGVPVVAAALIEPDGEPKKIFRVTLPSPLQLQYGTRIVVDQDQPLSSPFFTCFANGCMADYEGTPDLVTKLKKGKQLQVQAININGSQISFPVPLTEFQKANEGAPSDPKKYEEEQQKLQNELQKRAEEQRKKLEGQGGAAPAQR
jgi:invasion protein IalB